MVQKKEKYNTEFLSSLEFLRMIWGYDLYYGVSEFISMLLGSYSVTLLLRIYSALSIVL